MTKPELASWHCSGLDIDFSPDLSPSDASRIFGKEFSPTQDWSYLAYQEYIGEKEKYYCSLLAHSRKRRPSKRKAQLHVHISFGVGDRPRFARLKSKLPPAFDFLSSHPELIRGQVADVHARYFYTRDKYESVPKLPIAYPQAGFEHSEIAGVRVNVKERPSAKKPEFSVIMELAPGDRIFHNVSFSYKVSDAEKFLTNVLDLATVISQKFARDATEAKA
ncbi:MAG: hypothetical protein HY656_01540 [Acidobacteria bacterium]|nr:hypothetical protein [Acidobacteriota bacterium]